MNINIFEPLMNKSVFTDLARDVKLTEIDFSNGCMKESVASISQSVNEKSTSSLPELPEPDLSQIHSRSHHD